MPLTSAHPAVVPAGQWHHLGSSPALEAAARQTDQTFWDCFPRGETRCPQSCSDGAATFLELLMTCFTGTLASTRWHSCQPRALDDGSGRSRRHPDSSFLLGRHALFQHLWRQHGNRCAQLQRPRSSPGGGAMQLPPGVPGTLLPGTYQSLIQNYFEQSDFFK